ncbi:sugar porter family MFS transporter [Roseibium sp. RKSG952]|uniref:sugar porter family MFS transporter n=1 Tax=Roseibium sp. RKSG952 TaxID=2529384 RepID=UPI0012BBB640|nr:sugar porter family MFS transporter [Roseibium sp. RKSG952]MTH97994.1 sugar porter family MFS transporter [Roseibium sp. RKSG952]
MELFVRIKITAISALFGFLFGFDTGVMTSALPFLTTQFSLSNFMEGLVVSVVPLAAVAGTVWGLKTADTMGRIKVLLISAILFALGALGSAAAPEASVLLAARLLLGFAIGASTLVAPIYLAEIAPAKYRGAVVGTFQLMITIGILFAFVSGLAFSPGQDWRAMFAIGVIPAGLCIVGVLLVPETPRWLLMQGQIKDARRVLENITPKDELAEIDEAMAGSEAEKEKETGVEGWQVFKLAGVRFALLFVIATFVLAPLTGINAVLTYAPAIFSNAGFSGSNAQFLATIGLGVINVAVTVVMMSLVDRFGRRPLFITGFAGAASSCVLVAASYAIGEPLQTYGALVGLLAMIVFFGVGIGPMAYIYASELFPLSVRAKGYGIASMVFWMTNFILLLVFPVVLAAAGGVGSFIMFTGFCLIGLLFAVKYAPEPKGTVLERVDDEIERVFKGK